MFSKWARDTLERGIDPHRPEENDAVGTHLGERSCTIIIIFSERRPRHPLRSIAECGVQCRAWRNHAAVARCGSTPASRPCAQLVHDRSFMLAMSLTSGIKHTSIALGLYRPARWLSRRLRPRQFRAHVDDVTFFRSLLPAGALCFDIGANVGEKSEALLDAGVRVVAFEPNPMVIPELKARCGRSERWTYVPAAVGSEGAISTLYVCAQSGQTSLLRGWEGDVIGTCHVPVVTADAAVRAFGPPHYCKIDVEGWELEVLSGLSHRVPLLSFEFHLTPDDIPRRCAV
jgi:FkbM family methyltransferase